MNDIDQLLDLIWQDNQEITELTDKEEANKIYEILTKDHVISARTIQGIKTDLLIYSLEDIKTPNLSKINYCIRKLNQKERKKNLGHANTPSEASIIHSKNTKYKKFNKMSVFAEFKPSVMTQNQEIKPKLLETFQLIDLSQDSRKLATKK
ncbi:hypothetical protein FOG48_03278 [Hanseniaspora uvarum]|nr:hypothetical protein FOG48_03278 [Hanseniaspora uvarum]